MQCYVAKCSDRCRDGITSYTALSAPTRELAQRWVKYKNGELRKTNDGYNQHSYSLVHTDKDVVVIDHEEMAQIEKSEEAERQKKLKMELESAKDRLRKAEAALA